MYIEKNTIFLLFTHTMMTKTEHLKKAVRSIRKQFIGNRAQIAHFLAAFFSHYLLKPFGLQGFIAFPKTRFNYQNVILETRSDTIDFWTTLETYVRHHTCFLETFINEEKSPKLVAFLNSHGYKRLHIFWFLEEKHQVCISKMCEKYSRYHLNYDYE